MTRYLKVPNYEDVRLTEHGLDLLVRVHRFDQGARSDEDGHRERVYHPGTTEGHTAAALVRSGLMRYVAARGHDWIDGVEVTPAGCAILAAMGRS